MTKLNQHGWGVGAMIAFLCVFFVAIIVVAIISYHMGVGKSPTEDIADEGLYSLVI